MPSLALRPCANGCGELVEGGRCPKCRPLTNTSRKTAERGYDGAHKRLRLECFERDGWKCIEPSCQWEPQIVRDWREHGLGLPPRNLIVAELKENFANRQRHLHADHEIPIETRPDLRLSLDNLRTRCNVCHSRKTALEDGGFGNG